MSASFIKSPSQTYSSSYGAYGSGTVNPYASYFGSTPTGHGHHSVPGGGTPVGPSASSSGPSTSFVASSPLGSGSAYGGGGGSGQFASPSYSSSVGIGGGAPYISPISSLSMTHNPVFVGTPGSSKTGMGISSGSPPYFAPSPAQTRIIGGVSNSSVLPPPSENNQGQKGKMGSSTSPLGGGMFGGQGVRSNPSGSSFGDSSQHPEPMHYSPIGGSSPSSSGMHSGGPGSVYLPCYFLGLDHYYQGVPVPPSSGGGAVGSPTGSRIMGSQGFLSPGRSFKNSGGLFEPKNFQGEGERGGSQKSGEVKKKGPQIHGFGTTGTKSSKDFLEMVASTEDTSGRSVGSSFSPRDSRLETSPSSASGSPSKCWVTIFGFPAGASSFIISNFSTLGKIMEVKCTPGSNWLHIRFSNPIEAKRALNKNGKVLGQSIMVGVIPSDAKVIKEAEEANLSGSEFNARRNADVSTGGGLVLKERNSMETPVRPSDLIKSKIRPLASGSMSSVPCSSISATSPPPTVSGVPIVAREPFEVCRSSDHRSVPTPSTGIMTRAMEFMFGW